MVSSSAIIVAANSERLMCSGFYLGETVCLGNFEFIADYFSSLSLSLRRGDVGTAFMGSTRSGASTPRRAMIEVSAKEFLTASSEDGGSGLPSPIRRGMGAPTAPVRTTPWLKDILDIAAAQ
jgi:hypothetical protein